MSVTTSIEAKTTPVIVTKSVEEMIRSYDWDYTLAQKIMICESGGDPTIVNDSPETEDYSIGLFQINLYGDNALHRPPEDWLKNPSNNIYYAHKLYVESGWGQWRNCYNKYK